MVAACFIDNGASTTATAPSSSSTTDVPTTPDVSTGPTSTTTDDSTTDNISGTGETGTTELDPTTTTATTGPDTPATDCWDQQAGGWPMAGIPIDAGDIFATEFGDAFLAPDGLSLYITRNADHRFYRASRPDSEAAFDTTLLLGEWSTFMLTDIVHPAVTRDGELLFTGNGDIYYALVDKGFESDPYKPPVKFPEPLNTEDFNESNPTPTADGRVLIIRRDDGPKVGDIEPTWTFREFTRPEDFEAGDPFTGGKIVTPVVGTLGLATCPMLSPDGLHLFFTSTTLETFTSADYNEADIFYTRRPTLANEWEQPQRLAGLNSHGTGLTCAAGVTADGCQLTYFKYPYDSAITPIQYLATRPLTP